MKVSSSTRSNRRGFTLIELLVVIAIIAILAAILFPVFAKAREKARQTACLSNEKQLAIALLQYEQDYDECTPYLWFGTNGGGSASGGNYKWMDAIYPYVKSEGVFNCPDETFPYNDLPNTGHYYAYHALASLSTLTPTAATNGSGTGNFYYGSYGYNAVYRNDASSGGRTPPCGNYPGGQTSAGIVAPAGTVWIAEGVNYYFGWANYSNQPSPIINPTATPIQFNTQNGGSNNDLLIGRHTNLANCIYCDGHAKATQLPYLAGNVRSASDPTLLSFIIQAQ